MPALIWIFFIGTTLLVRWQFGSNGMLAYSVFWVVAIALFRRRLTIALTHLASKWGLTKATIDRMPGQIDLRKARAADPEAVPLLRELSRAGFADAGAWDIVELPRIRLALMVHRGDQFVAAIESASSIGAQLNLHTLYTDGKVESFTNSQLPGPPVLPAGFTIVRAPGLSADALLRKARGERRRDGIRPVGIEQAPEVYAWLYAEAMQARKARGD